MKKRIMVIVTSVLLLSLVLATPVFAQDDPPTEPTEEPTDPPEPEETPEPDEDTPLDDNPVCLFEREHSVLAGLATRYNVAYEDLVALYCESELGVGQIALALATVQQSEGTTTIEDLVGQLQDEEVGWGEIWQEMGLIGKTGAGGWGLIKNENKNKNKFQEEVQNEGEDDQLQIDAEHQENNGQGKKDKETGKPDTPPGQSGSRGKKKP